MVDFLKFTQITRKEVERVTGDDNTNGIAQIDWSQVELWPMYNAYLESLGVQAQQESQDSVPQDFNEVADDIKNKTYERAGALKDDIQKQKLVRPTFGLEKAENDAGNAERAEAQSQSMSVEAQHLDNTAVQEDKQSQIFTQQAQEYNEESNNFMNIQTQKNSQAGEKTTQAEEKTSDAEIKTADAEEKSNEAETKTSEGEEKSTQASEKSSEAEQKINE